MGGEHPVGTELEVKWRLMLGSTLVAWPGRAAAEEKWSFLTNKVEREFFYLVVGGGGGGGGGQSGSYAGGGGGGGGYRSNFGGGADSVTFLAGSKFVAAVGSGGSRRDYGSNAACGGTGGDSRLTVFRAGQPNQVFEVGGGGGGGDGANPNMDGCDGSSGGGAGGSDQSKRGGLSVEKKPGDLGHPGGANNGRNHDGGGGGGAATNGDPARCGGNNPCTNPARGGTGLKNAISGSEMDYAFGGAGGAWHGNQKYDLPSANSGHGGVGSRGNCNGVVNVDSPSKNCHSQPGADGVVIIRLVPRI